MSDSNISILAYTDDIRALTGVGIQAHKFLTTLAHKYKVFQVGVSTNISDLHPVEYDGVKIYPVRNYGNKEEFIRVFATINPDIVLLFSDPRFFESIFMIDNEIRTTSKICLYHLWDNEPYPDFNEPWYKGCDDIVMISKFSYNLFKNAGKDVTWIPHGFDEKEFYPMEEKERMRGREYLLNELKIKDENQFIIFWNNRNLQRKRPSDVVVAFDKFHKLYRNSILIMNTDVVDMEGTDLRKVIKKFSPASPIIINIDSLDTKKLNLLYNIADVTVNISYAEGFGLSVGESLMAGTPVICTETGGMIEQMPSIAIKRGLMLKPLVRRVHGLINAPYIFWDYVSADQLVEALEKVYKMKLEEREEYEKLCLKGVEHIKSHYPISNTVSLWEKHIEELVKKPSLFKEKEIITI